jgi:FeS assembly SUF system regulator
MFRLSKLTDYGIVLMTHVARQPEREAWSARDLAAEAKLPLPTVGKVLKELVHGRLLVSHRGTKGGYSLARRPEQISIADIIAALEGPIAVTECNEPRTPSICEHEGCCPVRSNWHTINRVILDALENLRLSEMAQPLPSRLWPLSGGRTRGLTEGLARYPSP